MAALATGLADFVKKQTSLRLAAGSPEHFAKRVDQETEEPAQPPRRRAAVRLQVPVRASGRRARALTAGVVLLAGFPLRLRRF